MPFIGSIEDLRTPVLWAATFWMLKCYKGMNASIFKQG